MQVVSDRITIESCQVYLKQIDMTIDLSNFKGIQKWLQYSPFCIPLLRECKNAHSVEIGGKGFGST